MEDNIDSLPIVKTPPTFSEMALINMLLPPDADPEVGADQPLADPPKNKALRINPYLLIPPTVFFLMFTMCSNLLDKLFGRLGATGLVAAKTVLFFISLVTCYFFY